MTTSSTNTALQTFDFGSTTIRIVDINGEPWFVAADVCRVLGLNAHRGSFSHHLARLTDDEITSMSDMGVKASGQGMGIAKLVSESGLYKLILRSDKPQAKSFQDWVTRTVLPAIRKDGAYFVGEEKLASGEMGEDEFFARALLMAGEKIERLKTENKRLKTENKKLSDELYFLTVDEFRALRHIYLSKGMSVTLGKRATKISKALGLPIQKQERIYVDAYGSRKVELNVYERRALDEAWNSLKH